MSKHARYLWGNTKVDYIGRVQTIELKPLDEAPDPSLALLYFDSTAGKLRISEDGTNWKTITTS